MNSSDIIQLAVLVVLLLLSAFFSSAETALTTVNRIRIQSLADEGNKRAAVVLQVISSQAKMLSAILIGNNVVNIAATALSTTLAIRLFGSAAVGAVTAVLTLLVLIFGEISPKNLAAANAESMSLAYAGVIRLLMTVLTPVIFIVEKIARGIVRLVADQVIKREDVYLIGVGCPGMKDRKTGELLKKCAECRHNNPVVCDEMAGEPAEKPEPVDRFAEVQAVEAMPQPERSRYFESVYAKCIRCYACRDVCPCCTCRECFVDQRRENWVGKQNNVAENRFYGLTRVMLIGDRCIECGECERACPMDLPLMKLNRKVIQDLNDLFGEFESSMSLDENVEPLITYDLNDREEFM